MLAAETVTRTAPIAPSSTAQFSAAAMPLTLSGRPDVAAIGAEVSELAQADPPAAQSRLNSLQALLSPVESGELARSLSGVASFSAGRLGGWDIPGIPDLPSFPSLPGLPSLPSLPDFPRLPGLPDLPSIPFPSLPNPIDVVKAGLEKLQHAVEALGDKLRSLPSEAANRLADSLRGDKARVLTNAEKDQIREAFRPNVDVDSVRIVNGPGDNPAAKAAFKFGGNPAITIGNTIYLNPDTNSYSGDLGQGGNETGLLIHEFTHVEQYRDLGFGSFGEKYARDLADHGFDRNEVYRYDQRDTTYAQETIEGQAEMVGDYAEIRNSTDPADQAKIADLEKRLEGTGIYGL